MNRDNERIDAKVSHRLDAGPANRKLVRLHIVREEMLAPSSALAPRQFLLVQNLGIVAERLRIRLVVIDEMNFGARRLNEPDRRGIGVTQIPCRHDRKIAIVTDGLDPAFGPRSLQFTRIVGAENGSIEATEIFLIEQRQAVIGAELPDVAALLFLKLLRREHPCLVGCGDLDVPVRIVLVIIQHCLGVVVTPRRRNEQRPATILRQDWPEICPCARVA